MPIRRKPGEVLEIYWAGSTPSINDRSNGGNLTVYVFVATFTYSQYSYVEGFLDMKSVNWLKEHPDLSAAQIEDWLLEEYPGLKVGSSTIRLFIKELRDPYAIPKVRYTRQYEAIPEVDMGEQIQVDWGQCWQKTVEKEKI